MEGIRWKEVRKEGVWINMNEFNVGRLAGKKSTIVCIVHREFYTSSPF